MTDRFLAIGRHAASTAQTISSCSAFGPCHRSGSGERGADAPCSSDGAMIEQATTAAAKVGLVFVISADAGVGCRGNVGLHRAGAKLAERRAAALDRAIARSHDRLVVEASTICAIAKSSRLPNTAWRRRPSRFRRRTVSRCLTTPDSAVDEMKAMRAGRACPEYLDATATHLSRTARLLSGSRRKVKGSLHEVLWD